MLLLIVGASVASWTLRGLLESREEPTPPPRDSAGHEQSSGEAPEPVDAEDPDASPSPAAPSDFASLFREVGDGVIRIETTACEGGGTGSGFLVAPDLIATVAHVVEEAATISLRNGSDVRAGEVIGIEPAEEVALVRTAEPFDGHVFTLSTERPDVGTDVAALGYPLGAPLSLSRGSISGVARRLDFGTGVLRGLLQTDTQTNPGNSGGPLVTADGTVLGLVEGGINERFDRPVEGVNYAVAAHRASRLFDQWLVRPEPPDVQQCPNPVRPDDAAVEVKDVSGHPDGPALVRSFTRYVEGINLGQYENSWAMLSPSAQRRIADFDKFAEQLRTSFIFDFQIESVAPRDEYTDLVEVSFVSVQHKEFGYDGQECSHWRLRYTMTSESGFWQIERAKSVDGGPELCAD